MKPDCFSFTFLFFFLNCTFSRGFYLFISPLSLLVLSGVPPVILQNKFYHLKDCHVPMWRFKTFSGENGVLPHEVFGKQGTVRSWHRAIVIKIPFMNTDACQFRASIFVKLQFLNLVLKYLWLVILELHSVCTRLPLVVLFWFSPPTICLHRVRRVIARQNFTEVGGTKKKACVVIK